MARSRLASKCFQTIPRLELMAAVSGAELVKLLQDELAMKGPVTCYSAKQYSTRMDPVRIMPVPLVCWSPHGKSATAH